MASTSGLRRSYAGGFRTRLMPWCFISLAKQSKATQQEYTVSLLLYLFLSVQAAEQPTQHCADLV